jgi:hypothetical protein
MTVNQPEDGGRSNSRNVLLADIRYRTASDNRQSQHNNDGNIGLYLCIEETR